MLEVESCSRNGSVGFIQNDMNVFFVLITNGEWVRGRGRESKGGDDDIQMVVRRKVTECERGKWSW